VIAVAEPLRNIAEAAEFLGIPEKTLRDKVTARLVPHTRIGRHVRFSEEHLAAIVAAGEQPVVTAPSRLQVVRTLANAGRTHPPAGPSTPSPPSGPKENVA
jgi:excisionase family DNA binding protein